MQFLYVYKLPGVYINPSVLRRDNRKRCPANLPFCTLRKLRKEMIQDYRCKDNDF